MSDSAKLPKAVDKKLSKCIGYMLVLLFYMASINNTIQKITSHKKQELPTEDELDAFLESIDGLQSALFEVDISLENANDEKKEN